MRHATHAWRTDSPPQNHVVEVWYLSAVILAVWRGDWFTPEGQQLTEVTHWRER